jgi:hypothetical protein
VTYTKDDGILTLHSSPPQTLPISHLDSLFTLPSPSGYEHIIGIASDFTIVQLQAMDTLGLVIQGQHRLPLSYTPRFIIPVDPMAWGHSRDWMEHDVLLSVSGDGELAFWVPETNGKKGWRCTGKVRTCRTGFRKVRCSSAKKTALSKSDITSLSQT